jgi:hypothetical protein
MRENAPEAAMMKIAASYLVDTKKIYFIYQNIFENI